MILKRIKETIQNLFAILFIRIWFPIKDVRLWKLKQNKMKKFSVSEMLIVVVTIVVIFVSEYIYMVQGNALKAIFIGLWPPTILGLLNFINSKRK